MPSLQKLIKCGIFVASEWENLFSRNECSRKSRICEANAEIAQLVEHNLAKVRVASSSLVFRSRICKSPGGGMVDALVSGASVERRAGSSPVLGTKLFYNILWRSGGIGRRATLRG